MEHSSGFPNPISHSLSLEDASRFSLGPSLIYTLTLGDFNQHQVFKTTVQSWMLNLSEACLFPWDLAGLLHLSVCLSSPLAYVIGNSNWTGAKTNSWFIPAPSNKLHGKQIHPFRKCSDGKAGNRTQLLSYSKCNQMQVLLAVLSKYTPIWPFLIHSYHLIPGHYLGWIMTGVSVWSLTSTPHDTYSGL